MGAGSHFSRALAGCLVLLAPLSALGSLSWDNRAASLTGWVGEKELVATFHFRNSGTTPVTLVSVTPSCHCTTAAWPDKPIAPGASGDIKATFEVAGNVGVEKKSILVVSDDAPLNPTELALDINVQVVAAMTTDTVTWAAGEAPVEKTLQIDAIDAKEIASIDAAAEDPAVAVRVQRRADGRTFILGIRPLSTAKPVQTSIACTAHFGGRTLPLHSAYAFVLP